MTASHYARPLRLDVQGQRVSAYRQPDFLLEGKDCADVVVELKRLMRYDISAEKKAERRIRAAVRDALGPDESLSAGCTLVLRSARPCVPVGGRWRDQFLRRLRNAFRKAVPDRPYDSRSRPPFELWRTHPGDRPFAVDAQTLRSRYREFMKLVKNADVKEGRARRLPAGGEYILLFLADGIDVVTCDQAEFWFVHERCRTGWQPRRITRIYLTEVSCDTAPCLRVSGLWPRPNGLSEDIQISRRRAVRFIQYAHGKEKRLRETKSVCQGAA
jgi:hypothetical protein